LEDFEAERQPFFLYVLFKFLRHLLIFVEAFLLEKLSALVFCLSASVPFFRVIHILMQHRHNQIIDHISSIDACSPDPCVVIAIDNFFQLCCGKIAPRPLCRDGRPWALSSVQGNLDALNWFFGVDGRREYMNTVCWVDCTNAIIYAMRIEFWTFGGM
jgi:hypothetical protein